MSTALEARDIVRSFGGVRAVAGVSLSLSAGEVTGLIGPNGAGKTTLFHCMSGVERVDSGRVTLAGRDITRLSTDRRARRGLVRTFQQIAVFGTMTVAENLRVGAENRRPAAMWRGLLGLPELLAVDALVERVLHDLGLWHLRDTGASGLPTGTLRLVELGRALCMRPSVLLLDEPASGLDDDETADLARVLRGVAETGTAVLLVEHDVGLVFDVASTVHVMARGAFVASGTPSRVRADPAAREAYLEPESA